MIMVDFYDMAIKSLVPNAQYAYSGRLIWNEEENNNTKCPTQAEIDAKILELQEEYDANQYQRDRQPEYPSIQDQLDMLYWDKINGTDNWQKAIGKVKTAYPKPESL